MIKGILLDIAGVVLDGETALPGAAEAVEALRAAGLPLRFLTNSTRKPRRRVVAALRDAGIEVAETDVLTPAAPALARLRAGGYRPHLLVHPDLEEDFAGAPASGPEALVLGDAGEGFSYTRLNAAFRVLETGAPFLALAANRVFRDADGQLSLDAGAFVRALEYASGTPAEVLGKPAPAFFRAGCESMGLAPSEVAMVGDDAESDVAGALTAGLGQAFLVETGKYRPGDEARARLAPTAVLPGLGAAAARILSASAGEGPLA
ncbi:TIGR01458 family HAD-type hydrolase [Salipiger sp. P9]|uniref:TIGR01458 family HAD-type hydrolase n=1 Tax=Salipiger pentaromativorans TaxID=2943193 RepID=UPI00215873D8|nr:TIGR01458 family HAD-type hydrolase [Salipiger pentaromativorans]MCR8547936.1 TIGR01458 family HAD-type hydrolase [Salipiger pentaromativorans]